MKTTKLYTYALIAVALTMQVSCSRSKYASLNTNPDAVPTIPPETELTTGQLARYNNSYEAFYDFYEYIRPWTQLFVPTAGNGGAAGAFVSVANADVRWSTFFNNVGPDFVDAQELIAKLAPAAQAKYASLNAIIGINMVEYAFYTTDPNGSMPYSQAFQARYTGNLTPTWDVQEALFDTLDAQLKTYITTLETTQTVAQDTGAVNELIYQGSTNKWIKAANSLRLRIAMRLINQNPSKLTTIANEILADPIGMISANSEDWTFQGGNGLFGTNNSNYNPIGHFGNQSLELNVTNFMVKTQDPRLRNLLQPAAISTQDEFDSAQIQGAIPATATWDGQIYRGQYASPDAAKDPTKAYYFGTLNFSYKNVAQSVQYPSVIQPSLLLSGYTPEGSGTPPNGSNAVPVITFADVCFMRAELSLRGLDNDPVSPQQLYNMGVTASLEDYDNWSKLSQVPNYDALGTNEVTAYLAAPGVVYQSSTALEQVLVQEYLHDYMNPSEAWALIKRTGYPSPTGVVLPLEALTTGGNAMTMPRRFPTQYPQVGDLNYTNDINAINAQLAQPGYGTANQITGKVWWDQ